LRKMPPEMLELLPESLRARLYRALILDKEPQAAIRAKGGPYGVVLRRDSQDAWQAMLLPPGSWADLFESDALAVSPTYLQAGHLASTCLELRARHWVDDQERPVVVIVVVHRGTCDRRKCPLPAAMEFFFDGEQWLATTWRINVDVEEMLLPPVGERKIRQGDMVFEMVPLLDEIVAPHGVKVNELPDVPEPGWTYSHHPEGVTRWVQAWWGEVVGVVYGRVVRFHHPERPTARVWVSEATGPLLLIARPATGETQYMPSRLGGEGT
jgi:hypothetical protein